MTTNRYSGLKRCLFQIVIITCYYAWESVAQDIILEVTEPNPAVQQSLCPNKQVVYECRILVGSTGLTWTLPTSETLGFSVAGEIDDTRITSDGKFTATLTGKMDNPETDVILLTSTLRIQPPLDSLNSLSLRCTGGTVENPVEESATITAITISIPASPQELRQDPSANTESSAVIQWTTPASSGGDGVPIMSYVVTANGENQTVVSGNNAYTISGLTYNTDYTVKVIAVNACGLESEAASVEVYIEAKEPPRPKLSSADLYCDRALDDGRPVVIQWMVCNTIVFDGRPVVIQWMYGAEEEGVVYPGEIEATVNIDSGAISCTATGTSCTAVITRDDVYTVTLTLSNNVGSAQQVMETFDLRPVVVETMINSSDQFGVSVSLRDICRTDKNHTVFVFFGTTSSDDCNLKQKMTGTISSGVPQLFFANTCGLSLGSGERYCVIATLEGDDGNLKVSTGSDESDGFLSTIESIGIIAAVAVVVSLAVGVVIGVCMGRCIWKRGHGRTSDKVIYEEPGSIIPLEENKAYSSL